MDIKIKAAAITPVNNQEIDDLCRCKLSVVKTIDKS